jgi:hypothetical protein
MRPLCARVRSVSIVAVLIAAARWATDAYDSLSHYVDLSKLHSLSLPMTFAMPFSRVSTHSLPALTELTACSRDFLWDRAKLPKLQRLHLRTQWFSGSVLPVLAEWTIPVGMTHDSSLTRRNLIAAACSSIQPAVNVELCRYKALEMKEIAELSLLDRARSSSSPPSRVRAMDSAASGGAGR